jgi:hypothetical protein
MDEKIKNYKLILHAIRRNNGDVYITGMRTTKR